MGGGAECAGGWSRGLGVISDPALQGGGGIVVKVRKCWLVGGVGGEAWRDERVGKATWGRWVEMMEGGGGPNGRLS